MMKKHHAQDNWESVFHAIAQPLLVLSPRYEIISANQAALRALNMTEKQVSGHHCYELLHAADRPAEACPMKRLLEDGISGTAEMRIETLGGTFLVSCTPIFDDGDKLVRIVHMAVDITERKRTEEALRESEGVLWGLTTATQETLMLIDTKGRILLANEVVARRLGSTVTGLIGSNLYDHFSRDVAKARKAEFDRVVETEEPVHFVDTRAGRVYQSHAYPIFSEEGSVTRVAIFAHDITERKQDERRLQESEARYRATIESSNDGVVIVRGETMLFCNKKLVEILGYDSADEIDAARIFSFVHPDDRERVLDYARRRQTGRPAPTQYDLRLIRKDGTTVYTESSSAMIIIDGEPASLGFIRDISRRKKAEDALFASQLKLAEAMNIAQLVYWEMDPRTEECIFNDAFYAFYRTDAAREGGYRMSLEEYGRRFIHPHDLPLLHQAIKQRRSSIQPEYHHDMEHRIIRRNGEVRHVLARMRMSRDTDGTILRCYGAIQDITERKEAEEERIKLWSAVERAGEGITMLTMDRRYSYVNAAFCKMFGFTEEELLGQSTAVTRSSRYPQSYHEAIWADLEAGKTWSARHTRSKKDGTPVEVDTTIAPIRDAAGNIIHYVGVERDITRQLELEAQFHHAQKMEAIGTLAGGVAHDFNNILTVIMGFASMIQAGTHPSDHVKPYIDQIVTSSAKAADLTRSLLAYSRKQTIALEPHRMGEVVADTAKLLKRLLPEDVDLKLALTDYNAVAHIDASQIEQVLMNLATNARDAMPHGGSLTISIRTAELDGSFKKVHGFGKPGRYVLISVSDTGIGMDEETARRVFDPFFTTKEVGKGTGLGLSSVYGIVKQHKGYITVTSAPHKGTAFDIYLPLVDAQVKTVGDEHGQVQGGSETVLVVEDDADVRHMLTTVLSGQGYTILQAVNGNDAIRIFNRHKKSVDLILLDVVMPGMNGRQVLDEITRSIPHVKAIFMSGYAGDIISAKGVKNDGVEFLQKPISVMKLLSKVRETLDR